MSKVFIDESTLTDIADAIRSKEGSSEKIPPLDMPERIIALAGGGADYLAAARSYTVHSLNDFGKKKVELYLPKITTLSSFCNIANKDYINTTVEELSITCERPITAATSMLSGNNSFYDMTLKKITLNIDTSTATNVSMMFNNMQALEEIAGEPLDFSSATSSGGSFTRCNALREIRFTGLIKCTLNLAQSPLSKVSIESVISVLSDSTSEITLTLKKSAVNKAFETAEGAADGSESTEWTALVDSKPNWTISLV